MASKATEEENDRYVKGICIACGVQPHSAGRPRCNECHAKHNPFPEPKLKRQPGRARRW